MQFKKLSVKAKREYRVWARENYRPCHLIDGRWHPVVQAECVAMNEEAAVFVMEPEAQEEVSMGLHEAVINASEFLRVVTVLYGETKILDEMDLSDEAWDATVQKLKDCFTR